MSHSYIEKIVQLLEEKMQLFTAYEKTTQNLLDCDVETVEYYITERSELATQVDERTAQISGICEEQPQGDLLLAAALGRANYEDIPAEMQPVFEASARLRTIVYRISGMEPQVVERLEKFRDEAAEKIKTNQHMPKIKKYLTDLSEKPVGQGFSGGKA